MNKIGLAIIILAAVAVVPAPASEKNEAASAVADFWVGKHRDEVVEILGPPEKSKKTLKGEVLTYLGPVKWMASGTGTYGHPSEAVDSEGNLVSPGDGGVGGGPASPVTSKMKLYLDKDGKVYKVKTGKSR
jgi:hypothetical protein